MNYKLIISTENGITEIRYLQLGSDHWQTAKLETDPISLIEDVVNYIKSNYENS